MQGDVVVRPVRPDEYGAVGDLTVAAYTTIDGFAPGERYAAVLRDVGARTETAEVLVAADGEGRIVGGVTFVPGLGPLAEFDGADESGMRMLAVDPTAQGRGIGRLLAQACIDRARTSGRTRLVLHTTGAMAAAHRLYRGLGFARVPARDLTTPGGLRLEAYVFELDGRPAVTR
jgi:GNAT superfamily N-acetyltransferase